MSCRILLVVEDPTSIPLADELRERFIWLVESDRHCALARHVWDTKSGLGTRLTTFAPQGDTREERCINILETLCEHYDQYSNDGPMVELEIIGARLTSELRRELVAAEFATIIETPRGITAQTNT